MTTKKLNAKQVRWTEKLAAFDFTIEYRKSKLNSANASSRKFDIVKSNNNENNNDDFFSILRNKFRNQNFQFDIQKRNDVSASIKLTALTKQLNDIIIANTQVTDLNEKVLAKQTRILNAAKSSRLLIHQILKSKKFYLKLRESIIA